LTGVAAAVAAGDATRTVFSIGVRTGDCVPAPTLATGKIADTVKYSSMIAGVSLIIFNFGSTG
jgi:hypothetical protein